MERLVTGAVVLAVAELRQLLGELEEDVVVVEDGGEAAVDDFRRHGSIGQQEAGAEAFVLSRLCNEIRRYAKRTFASVSSDGIR